MITMRECLFTQARPFPQPNYDVKDWMQMRGWKPDAEYFWAKWRGPLLIAVYLDATWEKDTCECWVLEYYSRRNGVQ